MLFIFNGKYLINFVIETKSIKMTADEVKE